jgi:hypothetical protein
MKKIIYTLSFLTVFAVAAKAQASSATQQEPKKETVKGESMESEVKRVPSPSKPAQSAQPAQPAQAQPAAPKTRMAINEKGVPASKTAEAKTKKEAQPAASPGQPTTTEKH